MITKEKAIEILWWETSLGAIEELKYYAGFNQDKVIEQIQEAMDMGAEALRNSVEIVRCKDCKNVEQDETTKSLWCGITMVFPEDFCSRGKKAEK